MTETYDAIVVGAGSVGIPTAMALGARGLRTLVVDQHASPGQGENKHAIGGVRATHSAPGKILTCMRSIQILSTWKELHGDDIEWLQGGYLYPVYREGDAELLKNLLPLQKSHGLKIDFLGPGEVASILPGIATEGLLGGTFAPEDGSMSPLLVVNAFYRHALAHGVAFRFKERVTGLRVEGGRVAGVDTDRGRYESPVVVDAAGPLSAELNGTAGVRIPVVPDCHEAAITEPVQSFFRCMVVDIRPAPGSKNFYFYQNPHGQVVFCITPDPPIVGTDRRETSAFLPQVCTPAGPPAAAPRQPAGAPHLARALPHDPRRLADRGLEPGGPGPAARHGHVRPGPDARARGSARSSPAWSRAHPTWTTRPFCASSRPTASSRGWRS